MTEKEKMIAGQLYDPSDAELTALRVKARKLARCYNLTDEDENEKQQDLLRTLLPNSSEMPGLQAPVYFDYGCNTSFELLRLRVGHNEPCHWFQVTVTGGRGSACYTAFRAACKQPCLRISKQNLIPSN